MNKVRLIKIYELRGKIHPIEASIIDLLDGIEKVPYDNYSEYNKEGIKYFYHNLNNNKISLYSHFYISIGNYGCSILETRVVLKYLLEKHLKIEINEVY